MKREREMGGERERKRVKCKNRIYKNYIQPLYMSIKFTAGCTAKPVIT